MNKICIFLIILGLISFTYQNQQVNEEDVVVLQDSTFQEFIDKHEFALVEFYAPWCGHCKQLAPEWAVAASALKLKQPYVPLCKVDATQNPELQNKFEIQGYPTIYFFYEGTHSEYQGPRDSQGIIDWVVKQTGPILAEVKSHQAFQKLKQNNQAVVLLFSENTVSHEYKLFESLARTNELEKVVYAYTTDVDIREKLQVPGNGNHFVIFKNYDDLRVDFINKEEWNFEEIYEEIIEKNIYPIIQDFDDHTAQRIFSLAQEGLFLMVSNNNEADQKAYKELDSIKYEIKDKIQMTRASISEGIGEQLADYLNINTQKTPILAILDFKGDELEKYILDSETEINAQSIRQFLSDYEQKNLTPHFTSEEAPKEDQSNLAVKKLVGSTFQNTVYNSSKDILVKFYSHECGHCRDFAPTFELIGEHYRNDNNIELYELNYNDNDVKGIVVEGLPTVLFFPANIQGVNDIIEFQGQRTKDELISFIEQNRKTQKNDKKSDL